jgi:hypothetical protein
VPARRAASLPDPRRGDLDLRPILALVVIAAGLVGAAFTGPGHATTSATVTPTHPAPLAGRVPDDGAPRLLDLRFSPGSVDVTSGGRNVTFTVAATDTGGHGKASGIGYGFVSLSSPDFARSAYTSLEQDSAGRWVGTVAIPRWTHAGAWRVNTLGLGDRHDNYETWSAGELTRLGHPTTLRVRATPDDTAPRLLHFGISHPTASVPTRLTVTAVAKDRRSGIASIVVSVSRPGTRHRSSAPLTRVTGSTYRGTLVIPRRRAGGTWRVDLVRLSDTIGNSSDRTYPRLRGFRRTFRISATSPRG